MRKAYSYIRMSTDTQLKGDSLRRQMEQSKNYADENNLTLIESIDGRRLEDIGVSAFNGKNATDGVLSIFLKHLESGNIEKDSVLLVESLDRLSRDRITGAMSQFISIINNGIEIVTLIDGQVYNKKIIDQNPYLIIMGLTVMMRANEESETKSIRGKAVWSKKRKEAEEKVITKKASRMAYL
jgi:DNA invertase Pin-like site-specific DNA recombinase